MSDAYDGRWRLTTAAIGIAALAMAALGLRYSSLPTFVVAPSVLPGILLVGAAIAPSATIRGRGGQHVGAWRALGGAAHLMFWAGFSLFALWLVLESTGWWSALPAVLAAVALSKLFLTARSVIEDLAEPDSDDEP